jgi:hypothetical protein
VLYKAGQKPSSWLSSAESLREAAEIIFQRESSNEILYAQALERANQELANNPDPGAYAEIRCEPPNYLPGELLYGYALENVLKGLVVANAPNIANEAKLGDEIVSHKLICLAKKAAFQISASEAKILRALTQLSEWAGRYPVARRLKQHSSADPLSDGLALLNYGADHPTVRSLFDRALAELRAKIPSSPTRFGVVVRLSSSVP